MKTIPYLLQALSPLHAGTGHSVGVIDLPIARLRASGIPFVPGSSIKGVLRDVRRRGGLDQGVEAAIFGPWREQGGPEGDTRAIDEHAGALMVGDARLLALPVRSFKGTFALVTSPLLLQLAARDMAAAGHGDFPAPGGLPQGKARVQSPSCLVVEGNGGQRHLVLEDLDLAVEAADPAWTRWAEVLLEILPADERGIVKERLAMVDDESMTFLWETATQLDTRVRIDRATGVVAGSALWTEESLPPETLLIGLLAADPSWRRGQAMSEDEILGQALGKEGLLDLQLGGKATVGRGRCRLRRFGGVRRAGGEARS